MTAALVLDFGGVISRTFFETHDLTEQTLNLPTGTLNWRGPFEPQSDPLWQKMQADEISERDYWQTRVQELAKLSGNDWHSVADCIRAVRADEPEKVIRPEALAAIDSARAQGHKVAILSNELDLFYGSDFRQKLPFLKHFDAIVDATYTEILKPDPRAYHLVLEALALPANACVFVDDQKRNIDGAHAVGLHTVHFDVTQPAASYQQALRLLSQAAGENPREQ